MNTEVPFLYSLIFFLFKLSRKCQSALSKIFYFITIRPALLLSTLLNVDDERVDDSKSKTTPFVTLDLLLFTHRVLWRYLKVVFAANSYITGVKHQYNLYEHLISWNMNTPVIGYEEDKTTFTFELLMKKTERGRSCDFTWLSNHKVCGYFKIISKEIKEDTLILKALWLTGSDRGKTFDISPTFPFGFNLKDKANNKPSSIYYPPRIIIFLLELGFSASAILAFLELTKSGWKILIPSIINIANLIKLEIITNYLAILDNLSKLFQKL